jgi:hypothetical protein
MLDALQIRCNLCKEQLVRGNFQEHIEKFCEGIIENCPATDFGCSFKASRPQIKGHIQSCPFVNQSIKSLNFTLNNLDDLLRLQTHELVLINNNMERNTKGLVQVLELIHLQSHKSLKMEHRFEILENQNRELLNTIKDFDARSTTILQNHSALGCVAQIQSSNQSRQHGIFSFGQPVLVQATTSYCSKAASFLWNGGSYCDNCFEQIKR